MPDGADCGCGATTRPRCDDIVLVGGAAVASLVALMLSGKKKRTVLLDDRNKPGGAGFVYNKAHIYDGIAHVSGQVAVQFLVGPGKRECSLEEEIRQVLQNLKER